MEIGDTFNKYEDIFKQHVTICLLEKVVFLESVQFWHRHKYSIYCNRIFSVSLYYSFILFICYHGCIPFWDFLKNCAFYHNVFASCLVLLLIVYFCWSIKYVLKSTQVISIQLHNSSKFTNHVTTKRSKNRKLPASHKTYSLLF